MTETPKAYTQTTLHETLRILRRRRLLIFGTTLLGFSLTALTIQNIKPTYTAHAQIQFDGRDDHYITTQIQHLRNENLARQILIETNLGQSAPTKHNSFKPLNLLSNALGKNAQKVITNNMAPQLKEFQKNLKIHPIKGSYVLNIDFHHHNAFKSAAMLNRLTDYYIQTQNIDDTQSTEEKKTAKNTLKDEAQNALKELREFEEEQHALTKEAAENNAFDEEIHLRLAEARAKVHPFLDKNNNFVRNTEADVIISSPLIQSLKLQRAMLEQEQKRLALRYGNKHPRMIAVVSDFDLVNAQIEEETNNIIERIVAEYAAARAEANVVETREIHTYTADENNTTRQLLQQRARKSQILYHDFLNTEQGRAQPQNADSKAKIIMRASIPTAPSFPNKPELLGLGTLLSLLFGLCLTFFFEKTRTTFLSGKQLEEFLNLPCYALIPRVPKQKNKPIADYVMDLPASNTAEAVRALRLTIKLRTENDTENKVVTVTSSHPNEGKTTLATWMARLAAKSGERVIIIDADLRRPSVHKSMNKNNELSLVEYLSGQNKLEEIIDTNDPSGLHTIYGRAAPNSALDLLASSKMDQLVRSLRKAYDLIIIDSPACLAVSDARALTKLSDQIIYAVSWNKTSREIVHSGISQFPKLSNASIATVLTNIDLKKHVEFGFGEAISDYSAYKE